MSSVRAILAIGAVLMVSAAGLQAQGLRDSQVPAEFPPAGYKGSQYVDSRGCVYIRAGVGGSVTWVPRVSRQRQLVCGFQPTFNNQPAAEEAPVVVAEPAPPPKPATEPVVVELEPTPEPAPAKPVVAPVRTKPVRVATAPQVKLVKPQPTQVETGVKVVMHCPNATRFSNMFINKGARCTPQLQDPNGRILSRHGGSRAGGVVVAEAGGGKAAPLAVTVTPNVTPSIPKGYRAAWSDGRLNPNRGKGTAQGQAQMNALMTEGVPMRTRAQVAAPVTVSTKSPVIAGQFIQVGLFTASKPYGQKAIRRLESLGLPVKVQSLTRGGVSYQSVMAGPFGTSSDLHRALGMARQSGYHDAYVRR